jgi:GNAT superfamily N-acetyltransferase
MSDVPDYFVKERLKDGSEIIIRAMRPDDKERLVRAFVHLEPQTIRMRFFYAKRSLSDDDLRWLEENGHGNHVGLVATVPSGRDELIIGEGSYVALGRAAETAFTVADAWQGRGIGRRLLQHLARIARGQGIDQFDACVLSQNAPMLAVFRHSGLPIATQEAQGEVRVTLLLDPRAAPL